MPPGPARRARYIRLRTGRSALDGWVRFLAVRFFLPPPPKTHTTAATKKPVIACVLRVVPRRTTDTRCDGDGQMAAVVDTRCFLL